MEESVASRIRYADPTDDRVEEANDVAMWKPLKDGSMIDVVFADAGRVAVVELTPKPEGATSIPENLDEFRVTVRYKETAGSSFKAYLADEEGNPQVSLRNVSTTAKAIKII